MTDSPCGALEKFLAQVAAGPDAVGVISISGAAAVHLLRYMLSTSCEPCALREAYGPLILYMLLCVVHYIPSRDRVFVAVQLLLSGVLAAVLGLRPMPPPRPSPRP